MSKCAGCFAKFKRFEKTQTCPECKRIFCLLCIPGKKVLQDQRVTEGRDVCVYCTKEQKERMKKEEVEAMENFHNRYYQNPHLLSRSTSTVTKKALPTAQPDSSADSEAIRKIEERLHRLKEPTGAHGSETPTEGDIKTRLENLRDVPSSDATTSVPTQQARGCTGAAAASGSATGGKTEAEEAQNLFEKASDELKLDQKVAGGGAEQKEGVLGVVGPGGISGTIDGDIKMLLDDMEVELPDEDPEKLLEELKRNMKTLGTHRSLHVPTLTTIVPKEGTNMKSCAEGSVGSFCSNTGDSNNNNGEGVKDTSNAHGHEGVKDTGSAHGCEGVKDTGKAHGCEGVKDTGSAHGGEAVKDCNSTQDGDGVKDIQGEGRSDPSPESDCIVRKKPHLGRGESLQFCWDHFGVDLNDASTARKESGRPCYSAGDVDDDGIMDDEVQRLIVQVLEETELESKMDTTGHSHLVEEWDHRSAEGVGSPKATVAPGGATPVTRQSAGGGGTKPSRGGASAATYSDFGKEDLPWCCICNDDAVLRCFDCDGDLYCRRCFAEGHEQFGLYGHQVQDFNPKQRQ